ncbi:MULTISPECIES: hypothetical protein [Peribacillus]|uniref:hypothetical protein n=1 Tax=Peribacillus TaxID=2675229 RepID=UPI001F4DFEEF|nr:MULTISPECIES: hypothetical protein [unclassified Peribacillus]MCK1985184.1 hypothetical protein [Peribacillus sp. Aquil_B1]MCK2007166.1 hypothetical protein [Peribacillus sp. Aquil_B8]
MANDFKSKVIAYQQSGDRTIINDIISSVETDFMINHGRYRVNDGTKSGGIRIRLANHHEYISYRIRAMRELMMKHVKDEVITKNDAEFQRLLSILYIDLKINFAKPCNSDYYTYEWELNEELFAVLARNWRQIKRRLTEAFDEYHFAYFKRLYKAHQAEEIETRAVFEARKKEIEESAVSGIEYALKFVNADRSEMEIVKYINKTFSCRFADDEKERNGMRKIQRKEDGKRSNHVVTPHFAEDNYRTALGIDVTVEKLKRLNKGQSEFVEQIVDIVIADRIKGAMENYTCDLSGEILIRKEYISAELGIKGAAVRQKLKRIKEKLA